MRDFSANFGRPRIPLFFKLWFGFVAILAVSIIAAYVWFGIAILNNPSAVGQFAGEIVSGFKQTAD